MGFGVQLHNSNIGTSASHKFIEMYLRQYVHWNRVYCTSESSQIQSKADGVSHEALAC